MAAKTEKQRPQEYRVTSPTPETYSVHGPVEGVAVWLYTDGYWVCGLHGTSWGWFGRDCEHVRLVKQYVERRPHDHCQAGG